MSNQDDAQTIWLPIIGRALAHLCLQRAQNKEPEKFDSVLKRVKFLEGLGLKQKDAAEAAGSSAKSVQVLEGRTKRSKANGTAKKKARR